MTDIKTKEGRDELREKWERYEAYIPSMIGVNDRETILALCNQLGWFPR